MLRIAALAFLIVVASSPARADRVRLSANLDAKKENPAVDSPGTATATVWYDRDSHVVTWDIYWTGLTGMPTAAHFHGPSSRYGNAGVQVDLGGNGFISPFRGRAMLTDEQAEQLLAGRWYVNLHTAAHPDGEIRGQVERQP